MNILFISFLSVYGLEGRSCEGRRAVGVAPCWRMLTMPLNGCRGCRWVICNAEKPTGR